jgi:hypothetical protein
MKADEEEAYGMSKIDLLIRQRSVEEIARELKESVYRHYDVLDEIVKLLTDLHFDLSTSRDSNRKEVVELCATRIQKYMGAFRESRDELRKEIDTRFEGIDPGSERIH